MIKTIKNKVERVKLGADVRRYKKWKKEFEQSLKDVEFELECLNLTPEERKMAIYKAEGLRMEIRLLKLKIDECILKEVEIIRGVK